MSFKGCLCTDYNNVEALVYAQRVCKDLNHATTRAIKSGVDMSMQTHGFFEAAQAEYNAGNIIMEEIDLAC